MISYKKTLELIKQNNIKLYKLVGGNAYINIISNGHMTTRTIDKLCATLQCQPGDLMEYIPDDSE